MKTIWKFPFEVTDIVGISMPRDAEILHVGCQNGQPTMWAIVDSTAPKEMRHFRIIGIGHRIPDEGLTPLHHIGTFQQVPFIWHVFDEIQKDEG